VFINMDPNAAPLAEYLGETVMRHLGSQPVRSDAQLWKSWHYGLVLKANWKVMAEAFFEAYHGQRTHSQLHRFPADYRDRYLGARSNGYFGLHHRLFLDPWGQRPRPDCTDQDMLDTYLTIGMQQYRDGGLNESVTAEMLPEGMRFEEYIALKTRETWAAKGVDLSAASDAELSGGTNLYFLFPNFMTFRGPTGHQAYRFSPYGDDPDWSIFEMMELVALPEGEEIPPDEPLHMMEPGETFLGSGCDEKMGYQTAYALDQDVANSPRIQKGIHGIAQNLVAMTMEKNIVAFHRNLRTFMGV
jgi:hypothetical protein